MKTLIAVLFTSIQCFAQQQSDIILDSSNSNDLTVHQFKPADSQKVKLELTKADSNSLHVWQEGSGENETVDEKNSLWAWMGNVNNLFGVAVGFVGLYRMVILYSRKRKR